MLYYNSYYEMYLNVCLYFDKGLVSILSRKKNRTLESTRLCGLEIRQLPVNLL